MGSAKKACPENSNGPSRAWTRQSRAFARCRTQTRHGMPSWAAPAWARQYAPITPDAGISRCTRPGSGMATDGSYVGYCRSSIPRDEPLQEHPRAAHLDMGRLMPRKLSSDQARQMAADRKDHRGGRPAGVRLPCGACGQHLTATEWRPHFARCPARHSPAPASAANRD